MRDPRTGKWVSTRKKAEPEIKPNEAEAERIKKEAEKLGINLYRIPSHK